jgi:hypothetical protein
MTTSRSDEVEEDETLYCKRGRSMVGIAAFGRPFAMVLDCEMWSCPACFETKRDLAMAGPRQLLAAGGSLFVIEMSDNSEAEKVRGLVAQRAETERKRAGAVAVAVALLGGGYMLPVIEYACVRRPDGSVIFASVNLGGPRALPRSDAFREVAVTTAFEELVEHWFRKDGLRQKFENPGESDLRTSASRGWTQKAQKSEPSGAIVVAGLRSQEAKEPVLKEFHRLASERCGCGGFNHVHKLPKEVLVELMLEAANLPYPDDVCAFLGTEVAWINPAARSMVPAR